MSARRLSPIESTLVLMLACITASPLGAQDALGWQLERLMLHDGSSVHGLLIAEHRSTIEFAEIQRPKGRPVQAIIKPFAREQVQRIERLPTDQREQLHQRFLQLKHRAKIEADRMEAIQLIPVGPSSAPSNNGKVIELPGGRWRYEGQWFNLTTSLKQTAARRCIVRVEQVFRAYRHLLAPRRSPEKRLEILLTGTTGDFRRMMVRLDLDTPSPALYLPAQNTIIASTDLLPLAQKMEQIEQRHQQLLEAQQAKLDTFAEQFSQEARRLAGRGFSSEEIAAEKRARQAALERESQTLLSRIDRANRRNAQLFHQHSHQAFGRLYHEAFHAYLENFVFADATESVPRWLNEGLAQVFEHGQLDGDHLRIDSPTPQLMQGLRADIHRAPLQLVEVVRSTASQFHGQRDEQMAKRLYYYSWGLAYYLIFQKGHSLEDMLTQLQQATDPVQGLKAVTKQELAELANQFHQFVQ